MNIDDYKKPAWATFCRVAGVIFSLIFFGIAITAAIETGETGHSHAPDHSHSHGHDHSHSHGETNGFQFKPFNQNSMVSFGFAVGSLIHFWFVAWCVETFAGIRHYARETAIALTGGKEEKAEDTKPTTSQEQ